MKKLAAILLFSMSGTVAFAQWGDEAMTDKPTFRDRIFTGGGLGASFSSYYSYISISPLVGYKITPKLAGGLQFTYRYTKYKDAIQTSGGSQSLSTNDYGVSPFLRFNVIGPLFLHAEYEYLNYEYLYSNGESTREAFNSFMAGGGLFQPVGRRAGFFLLALYNFSYKESTPTSFSPYDSPLILRAGITAGF